ncbi:alpha/beta fold hydrolase [Haloglycomyces albus]|uniref:alpha/beta fold hydrolase n=1 Tax=Haloglycomyces albus TaxID=526067 RepID=UPI0004AD20EA|nr:alpha/beta hydrolase [Haloglycomyces albus]
MASWKKLGMAGAAVGGIAAGVATTIAVPKYLARRAKAGSDDPYADEPFEMPSTDSIRSVPNHDGVSVHVETVGSEEAPVTAVFLHGYIQNSATFYFQRQACAERIKDGWPVQCVFYDQPGHGLSGALPKVEYSIADLASTLSRVVDSVAPRSRLVLIGHSMGGMVIQEVAERYPRLWERVDSVALVSSSASPLRDVDTKPMRIVQRIKRTVLPMMQRVSRWTPQLIERARRLVGDSVWLTARKQAFLAPNPSPSLVSLIEHMNRDTPIQTVVGYIRAILDHDGRSTLPLLSERDVLIVAGTDDALTPVKCSRDMAEVLTRAETAFVAARHNPQLEQPREISQKLLEIIYKSVEKSSSRTGTMSPPAESTVKSTRHRWWNPFPGRV